MRRRRIPPFLAIALAVAPVASAAPDEAPAEPAKAEKAGAPAARVFTNADLAKYKGPEGEAPAAAAEPEPPAWQKQLGEKVEQAGVAVRRGLEEMAAAAWRTRHQHAKTRVEVAQQRLEQIEAEIAKQANGVVVNAFGWRLSAARQELQNAQLWLEAIEKEKPPRASHE